MKIILLAILTFVLGGCSTTSQKQTSNTNNYAPWIVASVGVSGYKILVEPSTIKEVDHGIRKAWVTSEDPKDTKSKVGDTLFLYVYDCNTNEKSLVEAAYRENEKFKSIKFSDSKFKQVYPGTVGHGELTQICNYRL